MSQYEPSDSEPPSLMNVQDATPPHHFPGHELGSEGYLGAKTLEDSSKRQMLPDNESHTAKAASTGIAHDSLLDIDMDDNLDLLATLRTMEIRLRNVQAENKRLRDICQKDELFGLWPVLYRVEWSLSGQHATYADKPMFIAHGMHMHLEGQRRITSESDWERTQRDVPFVVYKSYQCFGFETRRDDNTHEDINSTPMNFGESVRILHEPLIRSIRRLFTSQPGLTVYGQADVFKDFSLRSPYTFFYHFEQDIRIFAANLGQHVLGFHLLLDYITEDVEEIRDAARECFSHGEIRDCFVPYLFKPGELLVSQIDGEPQIVTLESLLVASQEDSGSQRLYNCIVGRIAFDGNFRSVQQTTSLLVPTDPSLTFQITDLKMFPLRYGSSQLQDLLLERGRKFFKCRDGRYVSCTGQYSYSGNHSGETRYMVDAQAYRLLHHNKDEPGEITIVPSEEERFDSFLRQLPSTIPAFHMDEKLWHQIRVEDIQDVEWNGQAFHDLVADSETKTLIQAVVLNKLEVDKSIDFIAGKGTGLMVLLHGAPGTGKTLTAEGIAELIQRPLYRFTAGDVSTDPMKVEQFLEGVFFLARRWGCVVLLDEADFYLEKRSNDNMERNALVSVLLRRLEYFNGVLILTTNRVGQFDEAFISRIHLALQYKPLNLTQRRQIWENFIRRLELVGEPIDLDSIRQHVPKLSKYEMNGRQIRNVIKTARELALYEKSPIDIQYLERVIRVNQRFVQYMDDIEEGAEIEDGLRRETMAREKYDR